MSKIQEIWKDIPNYEGYYQVSNYGNVKSLDRLIPNRHGSLTFRKGIILKQSKTSHGYMVVSLCFANKQDSFRVNQLVALGFLNHKKYDNNFVVDHINNNKLDNRLENLQLLSHRDNVIKSLNKQDAKSKYIGVTKRMNRNCWRARITFNKKSIHIGDYNSENDAYLAYMNKYNEINKLNK